MASIECKQAIVKIIEAHGEQNIVGLQYAVQEDEEGFTLEVTDFNITNDNGEMEEVSAAEHNEALYCDLNDGIFDFLEEFIGEDDPQYGEIEL